MFKDRSWVLGRRWRVECLYEDFVVFPELPNSFPLNVDGERLVERFALVLDSECVIVRLKTGDSEEYDLNIYADQGHPTIVYTDDEVLAKQIAYMDCLNTADSRLQSIDVSDRYKPTDPLRYAVEGDK